MQVTFMQHRTSKIAPLNPTAKSNDQIKYINTVQLPHNYH